MKRPRGPIKVKLFVPFGVNVLNLVIERSNKSKNPFEETLERSLMDQVLKQLQLNHYTSTDIEMVKRNDDLEGQVKGWVDKNLRMLSFGKGGVYKTLVFEISPRVIEKEAS